MVSAGKGSRRCLFPLPRTRMCASANWRSSSRRSRVSWERRPFSNGNHALWAAVTQRGTRAIEALELVRTCGHRMSGMEAIQSRSYIHWLLNRRTGNAFLLA